MSAAVLFIDVPVAVYVVLRPLVLAARTPDEALKALQEKGVKPETLDYIARHMGKASAIDKAGLSALAKSAIAASHEANWLTVDGEERSIPYDQGSILGGPW
eukprot:9174913-Alexandrium_andersonii.AAC.1